MKHIVTFSCLFALVVAFVLANSDRAYAQRRSQQNNNARSTSNPAQTPANTRSVAIPDVKPPASTATERGVTLEFVPTQLSTKPKSWAVLVGINDYVKLANLNYCVNDIKAVEASLLQTDFDRNNVFCLTSGADEKNLPTRNNIVQVINLVCRNAGPEDFVFISLHGHGIQIEDVQYFCPSDMDDAEDRLEETAISIDWIYKALENSQAKFKLIMVDACRDNPFKGRRSAIVAEMGMSRTPPPGIALLRSCGAGETSLEDAKFGHGVFTHFLLEGLTGVADTNGDGMISFLELYIYTQGKTQAHAIREHRSSQTPYIKGEMSDFPFARGFANPTAVAAATNTGSSNPDPQTDLMREMVAELRTLREERNAASQQEQDRRIRELEEQIEAARRTQTRQAVQPSAQSRPQLSNAEVNRIVNQHIWTTPKIADDISGLKAYVRQYGKLPRSAMNDLPPAKRQQMRHLYD